MKERERETSAYYYTRASLASAPRSPGRRKNLGRFAWNSSMIKRHENDMLFTLLWYGSFRRGGGQIFGALGVGKHVKMLQGFIEQLILFFPSYTGLSVKHTCCVQGKWALRTWQGKQTRRSLWPPRKIINVGSKKKESENCLTALFLQSQKVSDVKVYYVLYYKKQGLTEEVKIIIDSRWGN